MAGLKIQNRPHCHNSKYVEPWQVAVVLQSHCNLYLSQSAE